MFRTFIIQDMKINEGVEWAVHCCLNLSWVAPDRTVTAAKLAAFYNLPTAYLNKQLQALGRAGIVSSISGPRGGFQLARRPEKITLMDVIAAIEGPEQAFRCTAIRQRGPAGDLDAADGYRKPCAVSQAMRTAEFVWRKELASRTVADIKAAVERSTPQAPARVRRWFDNSRT
ncbi:Rrf2 family transcriptional regulator [Streptantibioticus ferralitis]